MCEVRTETGSSAASYGHMRLCASLSKNVELTTSSIALTIGEEIRSMEGEVGGSGDDGDMDDVCDSVCDRLAILLKWRVGFAMSQVAPGKHWTAPLDDRIADCLFGQ